MKTCEDCRFCILKDYGYSNWTVEGTDADCLLNENPGFPVDRFYGEEVALKYANECSCFSEGDCVSVDVDQEDGDLENYSQYEDVKAILRDK